MRFSFICIRVIALPVLWLLLGPTASAAIEPDPVIQKEIAALLITPDPNKVSQEHVAEVQAYAERLRTSGRESQVNFLEQLVCFQLANEKPVKNIRIVLAMLAAQANLQPEEILDAVVPHWFGADPKLASLIGRWIQTARPGEYSFEAAFRQYIPYMKARAGADDLPPEAMVDYFFYRSPDLAIVTMSSYYGEEEEQTERFWEAVKKLPIVSYGRCVNKRITDEGREILRAWSEDERWWVRYASFSYRMVIYEDQSIWEDMAKDSHQFVQRRGERLLNGEATSIR